MAFVIASRSSSFALGLEYAQKRNCSKGNRSRIPWPCSLNVKGFKCANFTDINPAQIVDSPNVIQIGYYAYRKAVKPRRSSLQELTVAPASPTPGAICASRCRCHGSL